MRNTGITLVVQDYLKSAAFYEEVLGAELAGANDSASGVSTTDIVINGIEFHLCEENLEFDILSPEPDSFVPAWFDIIVPDVEKASDAMLAAGSTDVTDKFVGSGGQRTIRDIYNYTWVLHQDTGENQRLGVEVSIVVSDPEKAMDLYKRTLAVDEACEDLDSGVFTKDGVRFHLIGERQSSGLVSPDPVKSSPVWFDVSVPNIHGSSFYLSESGGSEYLPPSVDYSVDAKAVVCDPYGYIWSLFRPAMKISTRKKKELRETRKRLRRRFERKLEVLVELFAKE